MSENLLIIRKKWAKISGITAGYSSTLFALIIVSLIPNNDSSNLDFYLPLLILILTLGFTTYFVSKSIWSFTNRIIKSMRLEFGVFNGIAINFFAYPIFTATISFLMGWDYFLPILAVSLLFFSWMTFFIGSIGGGILGYLQEREEETVINNYGHISNGEYSGLA